MDAIDTNVIVRYLTGDHPRQSAKARSLIETRPVHVATTVLLETEWVLRSAYGYSRSEIAKALIAFAGLAQVTLEAPQRAATALGWLARGMDFADALHLSPAGGADAFLTFDRSLARIARRFETLPVAMP